jgi:hypothetical protein
MPNSIQHGSKLPGITLKILDPGVEVVIEPVSEIILGRGIGAATPEMNSNQDLDQIEIDLSSFMAYEAGVSRRHALISLTDDRVTITDLESANGTRLNGQDILANLPSDLDHGDILTLGKLKIQFLINRSA